MQLQLFLFTRSYEYHIAPDLQFTCERCLINRPVDGNKTTCMWKQCHSHIC